MVVEDGTGLPNAESYESLENADAYMAARGHTGWAELPEVVRTGSLMRASLELDHVYAGRWAGVLRNMTQRLSWPRAEARDIEGRLIEGVPLPLRTATLELARIYADGLRDYSAPATGPVESTRQKVGQIETETSYGALQPVIDPREGVIAEMVRGLLRRGRMSKTIRRA